MRSLTILLGLSVLFAATSCKQDKCDHQHDNQKTESQIIINADVVTATVKAVKEKHANASEELLKKGVEQTALLWRASDGSTDDFKSFCVDNYRADETAKLSLYKKLERNYEVLWGNYIKLLLELREPVDMDKAEIDNVDLTFSAFNPQAHLEEDLYKNKIAFVTVLNFPSYTLAEKQAAGDQWTDQEWGYARMGDIFTARVPSDIIQNYSKASSASDAYISSYNIHMGSVLDTEGKTRFPEGMNLITHWNLRDELKSNYAIEKGQEKQEMIYTIMKRIIDQSIPEVVINNGDYQWDIEANKVLDNGKEIEFKSEPNTRYQYLLDNFLAIKKFDDYYPSYPSYIERRFSGNMEIPQEEIEALFVELVSSPEVKAVAEIIKKNIGRELRPYDIWYNGFKAQSSLTEEELNKITQAKYPNPAALEADMANILKKLDFKEDQAKFLASKIRVDGSRGAGHAWGAEMKSEKARLRTRIGAEGMNYKGYNIAVHEFGHNVEQTITLHDVPNYMMHGVPNTAFTEALAFVFQARDLELLGVQEENPEKVHMMALANFWSSYEIMGVSLVDQQVWKWMYANPEADAAQLKDAVMTIAKDVWNKYYAPVFGTKDEPILAIYSHMIDNPLYLSAYPIGHLIDFQIEKQIHGKVFADEVNRIYKQGRLVPQLWMKRAVGEKLSVKPLLEATQKAVVAIK
jgi:hypothetical protein